MSDCKPRLVPQLNGAPTESEDCGVSATRRAINWASCGKVKLGVAETRRRMNKPTGPANVIDWYHAMQHPDTVADFKAAGLEPPVVHLRGCNATTGNLVGSPIQTVITALEAGDLVCAAEGYGPWHGTRYAGSEVFGTKPLDNHAVSYYGITGTVGSRRTTRYDPLDDGRRPGIPDGPITVPFHLAADAMGDLTFKSLRKLGRGEWAGMVIERAQPIVTPPPPDTCAAELDAAYQALEAARQAIADLRVALGTIEHDAQTADDDAAAAITAIDALLGNTDPKNPAATVSAGVAAEGDH